MKGREIMDNKLSILTNVSGGIGLAYGLSEITTLIGQIAALISGIAILLNIVLKIVERIRGVDTNKDGKITKDELISMINDIKEDASELKDAADNVKETYDKLKSNDKDGD